MKLYFGGGEVPAFRKILTENGTPPLAASSTAMSDAQASALKDYHGDIFLDSGAYSFNRPDSDLTFEDANERAARHMNLVKTHIDNLTLVSEFDANQLGKEFIIQYRREFYNSLPPEKFMPVWHPDDGREELERLCASYQVVGASQDDIHGDLSHATTFNQMITRYGVRLHGVGITSKKLLEAVKWDSASSTSWLTPSKYGETFVWTGRELKRYPKDYKDRRRTHRTLFIDNGFDYEKIEGDDSEELLKLSLWSWQQYAAHISGVTTITANKTSVSSEVAVPGVDNLPVPLRMESIDIRSTTTLPIMSQITPRAEEDGEELPAQIIVRSESMRMCDGCFLKDKCPGFQPSSNCLYNIPIEIKTKDQLKALHDALIEMQAQRVLFMKMSEDLSGGYADPNLSSEMDRLNRMIKTKIEGDRNTFSMTINASETQPRSGFMEKMLGASATSKLRELEAPVDADSIMEAEIVE